MKYVLYILMILGLYLFGSSIAFAPLITFIILACIISPFFAFGVIVGIPFVVIGIIFTKAVIGAICQKLF